MIAKDSWINLPVGSNLVDHLNVCVSQDISHLNLIMPQTDVYVTHPDVVFYDFYAAWLNPNPVDKEKYLSESPCRSFRSPVMLTKT